MVTFTRKPDRQFRIGYQTSKLSRNGQIDALRASGIVGNYIAGGVFGEVFHHGFIKGQVVKVTNAWDKAYWLYLRTLQRSRVANPFLPRIYSVVRVLNVAEYHSMIAQGDSGRVARRKASYLIVVMEALKSARKSTHPMARAYRDYYDNGSKYDAGLMLCKVLAEHGLPVCRMAKHANALLNRASRRYQLGNDQHIGNVMMRGKQLVFTDPFSAWDA